LFPIALYFLKHINSAARGLGVQSYICISFYLPFIYKKTCNIKQNLDKKNIHPPKFTIIAELTKLAPIAKIATIAATATTAKVTKLA